MTTLKFQMWPWPSIYLNKCFKWHCYSSKRTTVQKLFWNPWKNVEVMARTSSVYDHFLIWPSSVTLTFNLPEQKFKIPLLILKENYCAQLFWNQCINVEVMARTNPIYAHFISFDLQVWPWPSNYLNKRFKRHFYSLRRTTVPNYFQIHS